MRAIVSLREVARELDKQTERTAGYLNARTGEMITLSEDLISAVEDMEEGGDHPDWTPHEIAKAREVLESEDWLPLPGMFEIDEYSIAEGFAGLIVHEEALQEVQEALRGRGALERFRQVVGRHGITTEWYNYRAEALQEIAREWLEEHGIPYTTGPGARR